MKYIAISTTEAIAIPNDTTIVNIAQTNPQTVENQANLEENN